MRFYQLDAESLAKQLNSDAKSGRSGVTEEETNSIWNKIFSLICGVSALHRSKFYYVHIIAIICFGISLLFSFLNQSWELFRVTIGAIIISVLFYVLEGVLLFCYKKKYFDRIASSRQKLIVIRDGKKQEIAPHSLVLGDLLCLKQGGILYSDARVLECEHLFADEKYVFGTQIPAAKFAEPLSSENLPADMQNNMLWKGSYIHSGNCICMVTALGEDCYVEKTGGRKEKQQHSFFYSKQNNIGHLASYVYVIFAALFLLIAVLFTSHYVEAFLMMGVLTSVMILNPVACLTEWTYYRMAKKLYEKGALIRNIEAFDGMNQEKELYFDADRLLNEHLTFSHTVPVYGSEKSSLSYFALCVEQSSLMEVMQSPLERCQIRLDRLNRMFPGSRREQDRSGNYYGAFLNNGKAVVVATGYWQRMLSLIDRIDDSIASHIDELERQGKMVWIIAGENMDYIPGTFDFSEADQKLRVLSLIVFNIHPDPEELSVISQLRKAAMQVHLICDYSQTLGKSIAATYDIEDVVSGFPKHSCYSLPNIKEQTLVADENSSPMEKEQANLVLTGEISPHLVIHQVKCMFCGLRRSLNFMGMIGLFLALTVLILFLTGAETVKMMVPVLLMKALLLAPCYYLIESTRNCNQYGKSLLLGIFCGLTGFAAALFRCDMALFALQFSMLLLSVYLLIRGRRVRPITKKDILLLVSMLLICIVPCFFMGNGWLTAILFSLFVPLATFILDLFY